METSIWSGDKNIPCVNNELVLVLEKCSNQSCYGSYSYYDFTLLNGPIPYKGSTTVLSALPDSVLLSSNEKGQ